MNVNPLKGILPFMTVLGRRSSLVASAARVTTPRGPTLGELRAQVRRALREKEGVDHGPLTREERDKLLKEQFGI